MINIKNRVAALEGKQSAGEPIDAIVIRFLTPGKEKPDLQRLRRHCNDESSTTWERQPDESESAFIDRAANEARQKPGDVVTLFEA